MIEKDEKFPEIQGYGSLQESDGIVYAEGGRGRGGNEQRGWKWGVARWQDYGEVALI